jgi:predicted Zn-dependent protease
MRSTKPLLCLVALPASLLFFPACGNTNQSANQAVVKPSPKPSPSPPTPSQVSAEEEKELQEEEDSNNRLEAREAVAEYVKSNLPKHKIKGVSLLSYTGNLYIANVDLSEGEKHQTVSLIVRMYIKENGETYWKADKLSEDDKRLLISRKAYELKRRLLEAKAEIYALEQELAARDEPSDEPDYEPPTDPRN